jgi:hypothetical protein
VRDANQDGVDDAAQTYTGSGPANSTSFGYGTTGGGYSGDLYGGTDTADSDGDGTTDNYDSAPYVDDRDTDGDGRANGYDRDKYADDIHDRDFDGRMDGYDDDKFDDTVK